jgi:hypothetical protein
MSLVGPATDFGAQPGSELFTRSLT